nr:immunoglobulin light chain junction region [Macaca mulatta]
CRHYYTTPYSF